MHYIEWSIVLYAVQCMSTYSVYCVLCIVLDTVHCSVYILYIVYCTIYSLLECVSIYVFCFVLDTLQSWVLSTNWYILYINNIIVC